jgi:hypothetical protein
VPTSAGIPQEQVREALRLLGHGDVPTNRAAAHRLLREHLRSPGAVRTALDRAPEGARAAFVTLAREGAGSVETLLGRGWWGRGTLPPPLDWLQRRCLVLVGDDAMVYPTDEAREGFLDLTLDLRTADDADGAAVRVEPAGAVVVVERPAQLDRAVSVPAAALRAVAPTVAVSDHSAAAVTAALRAAGVPLADDLSVDTTPEEPALPLAPEDAVVPRAIRAILTRAVEEGRQVRLQYFASSRGGSPSERVVCPWSFTDDLLVGHCHLRNGERTFAVDRIGRARLLPDRLEHPAPDG